MNPVFQDSLTCSLCGAGPLSRMYATSVPFARLAMVGWMLPAATRGSLNRQVCPPLSVMAISEKLKPSEYKGTSSRPPSRMTALFFVCHPIRWK